MPTISTAREILQLLRDGKAYRGLDLVKASVAKRGTLRRVTVYMHLNRLIKAGYVRSRENGQTDPLGEIKILVYEITKLGREALLRGDV